MGYGVIADLDEDELGHPDLVRTVDKEEWLSSRLPHLLFGSDAILAAAIPWPELPYFPQGGIYFLIWKDRICYVGQAATIGVRLQQHWKEGRPIQKVAVILDPPRGVFDELEHAYIHAWNPPWNAEDRRSGCLHWMPELVAAAQAAGQVGRHALVPAHFQRCQARPHEDLGARRAWIHAGPR